MSLLREFKPALLFLGKFLAIYFIGNILYGVFIESFGNSADPITRMVTKQTSFFLNVSGYDSSFADNDREPTVMLSNAGHQVLGVFEGCNGVNVMIVFAAFLFAFGGSSGALAIFVPLGLLIIHLFNLARVGLLFHLAMENTEQFHYFHKYLFTATLYAVVFGLWIVWVIWLNEKRKIRTPS